MDRFKKILQKIFFLPPLPMVLIAIFGFGFVIAVAAFKIVIPAMQYLSYISSAYALTITITGFPHYIAFARAVKRRVMESVPMKKFRGTAFGKRFFGGVCVIVIAMAVFMLWKSARQLKKLRVTSKGETGNEQGNL